MTVLDHDDTLVVVDKPAGLLAVPGRGPERADCVYARVLRRFPDALVVHRLDQATSGLMVCARGLDMQRKLNAAFADREVHKRYEAIVHGLVDSDEGLIDLPLIADWPNRPRQKVDHEVGKPSSTRWQVLNREPSAAGPGRTRVSLEPLTGRSHQLRVHLMSLGHPIVGDELYGPQGASEARMLLHAHELQLRHPRDGRLVQWVSATPF